MRVLAATLCLILSGTAALAGAASERVFSRAALDLIDVSQVAVYSHVREGNLGEVLRPVADGEIRVALRKSEGGTRQAVVTMGQTGKLRPVSVFPAKNGSPLVPMFLESAVRAMARATGGSEFYIRNRIKEAFGGGGTVEAVQLDVNGETVDAERIVFEPFANDRNRDRMGEFADLTLRFTVSDTLPGDVIRFIATTGGTKGDVAYRETFAFQEIQKED